MKNLTVSELLHKASVQFKNSIAFVFPEENKQVTFAELDRESDKVAKALLNIGFSYDAKIGIWSTNSTRWLYVAMGAAKIGAVIVPLNVACRMDEVVDMCKTADVNLLFAMEKFKNVHSVEYLSDHYKKNGRVNKENFPSLHTIYSTEDTTEWADSAWQDFIENAAYVSDEELEAAKQKVVSEDLYVIQFTSGTTAKPKGAMITHSGAINCAFEYVKRFHLDSEDITYAPLPLFHCFGNVLTLLGTLISGGKIFYPPVFSVRGALEALDKEKCSCFMGVPAMYSMLIYNENFDSSKVHIKKAGIGGAFCPPALADKIEEKFKMHHLVVGYGLSEVSSVCCFSDINDTPNARIYSIGKPLANIEMSLMDPETGKIDKKMDKGEVVVRGGGVMKGYYNDPENTAKALDAEGWLHTGDLGYFDSEGCLHLVGRIKDIIIRGGENISAEEIEQLIVEREDISDCQCVGVPDDMVGEEIAAFIIPNGTTPPSDAEIKAYVECKLAKYKVPKYIFRVEEFPLNAAGKVLKRKLREQAKKLI